MLSSAQGRGPWVLLTPSCAAAMSPMAAFEQLELELELEQSPALRMQLRCRKEQRSHDLQMVKMLQMSRAEFCAKSKQA